MINVTNVIQVNSSRKQAWELISDFEGVWENSNPAHQGTKVLSQSKRPLRNGLKWWQREEVGWVQGEFVATLDNVIPEQQFTWSTTATYQLLGVPFKVNEGGKFIIEEREKGIVLKHELWGKFEDSFWGKLLEWIALNILKEETAIAEHNLTELRYFKKVLENKTKNDQNS
ncbi:hypothetical protein [Cyanothece sp. BG0011]|uniref:hypothetical protein n=1 Tax=Cyanothece sp. BG0011 TaxID=2082950 RepID=UPI000D1D5CD8|nr:hypothetical protein [Cyanothece sp. BG0011]